MNAGLLPLVDQGWLWPRTKYERWRRIGPMMPGEHSVTMLAECRACVPSGMADVPLTPFCNRREGRSRQAPSLARPALRDQTVRLVLPNPST